MTSMQKSHAWLLYTGNMADKSVIVLS